MSGAGVRLSVIIPTLNEEEHVVRAIRSAQECGASEVIVADGGSRDHTPILAAQQAARVLTAGQGRAQQQNAGAAAASGNLFLFLHADNHLDPACGRQIREVALDDSFVAAAFRQRIEATGWSYRLLERGNAFRAGWLGTPYGDQGLLIRRTVFEQLGGFPEVALMEDLLLARKLRRVARPTLLRGPLYVSPRRWQKHGVIRQTLRNWALLSAHTAGVAPHTLARFYPQHADANEVERVRE